MKLAKAARIILVGAPGVGKGTQSERLLKKYAQLSSVSSGDLLRKSVRDASALGLEAQKLMKTGLLVPDTMILQLIVAELAGHGWLKALNPKTYTLNAGSGYARSTSWAEHDSQEELYEPNEDPASSFILDGFPRTAGQATKLDELVPINLVVHLSTPTEIILDRIANRWIHAPSGRVYNTTFNPPKVAGKDDITGETLTRREDDCPETWKKRLQSFDENNAPLLEHYDKAGILWKVEGNSSDEITPKLLEEFGRRFGAEETVSA